MEMWGKYKEVDDIAKKLGLKKVAHEYKGIMCTGQFDELFDYNYGFLFLCIRGDLFYPGYTKSTIETDTLVTFRLGTMDDGTWGAVKILKKTHPDMNEYMKNFIKELAGDFIDNYGHIMPTAKEANILLSKYGMYGIYEG